MNYPILYSKDNKKLAVLDNIILDTASINRVVNGEFTFAFSAYEKELKSEFFNVENKILIDGNYFDIASYKTNHYVNKISYDIECEHISYRLIEDAELLQNTWVGTPREIAEIFLQGTEFTVGKVDYKDSIVFNIEEVKGLTKLGAIKKLVTVLGAELDYSDNGMTLDIVDTIGKDNGFQVRFGKNLKGISKTIDRRGGLKTFYEIDNLELKNSNEYIEKDLVDLEVVECGDSIRMIDNPINLDEISRILSVNYNPIYRKNTSLEIGNILKNITDSFVDIDDKISNIRSEIKISNEEISSKITEVENGVEVNKSSITQTLEQIESVVKSVDNNASTITQNADNIEHRVKKDGVVSSINQSAEAITIKANKIDIDGVVEVADLVVGENVRMGSNATIEWNNVDRKPSYLHSTKITNTSVESSNIVASKFWDSGKDTYLEISPDGEFADLNIKKKSGEVTFQVRDMDDRTILSSYGRGFIDVEGDTAWLTNFWKYNGYEIANKNDLKNVKVTAVLG